MGATSKSRRKCVRCGASFSGSTALCTTCLPATKAVTSESAKRVAAVVKERIATGRTEAGPICPFCKIDLDWDNIGTIETEVTIYVREKIYFCPGCRAFLGVSSWHTEG